LYKLYSFIENEMTTRGNVYFKEYKILPIVAIHKSYMTNTMGVQTKSMLESGGDIRSHLMAAVVFSIIRDVVHRMRHGLNKILDFRIPSVEEILTEESEDNNIFVIPKAQICFTKSYPTGQIHSFSNILRPSDYDEAKVIVNAITSTAALRKGWNSFSKDQFDIIVNALLFFRKVGFVKATTTTTTTTTTTPPAVTDKGKEREKPLKKKRKTSKRRDRLLRCLAEAATENMNILKGQPCPYCTCPEHGHNDLLTNDCPKGCNTEFRIEDFFKTSPKDNLSSFERALMSVPMEVLIPREEEENDVEPDDALMDVYEKKMKGKPLTCVCLFCNSTCIVQESM